MPAWAKNMNPKSFSSFRVKITKNFRILTFNFKNLRNNSLYCIKLVIKKIIPLYNKFLTKSSLLEKLNLIMSLLKEQFWVRRESDQPLIAQIRELRLVKAVACNAGVSGDTGSIPGLEISPEEDYGNPLQYSCLENPMDRGAWQATVHGVTKGQTWQTWLSTHALIRTQAEISRTGALHPTNFVAVALVCLSYPH